MTTTSPSISKSAAATRAELTATLAALRDHERNIREKDAELHAAETADGADTLLDDPQATTRIASLVTEQILLKRAIAGAGRRTRELALLLAKEAARLERGLVGVTADNLDNARVTVAEKLRPWFDAPGPLAVAVGLTRLVASAARAVDNRPSPAIAGENDRELHPDIQPQQVLDGVAAVERAVADAESLAKQIAALAG